MQTNIIKTLALLQTTNWGKDEPNKTNISFRFAEKSLQKPLDRIEKEASNSYNQPSNMDYTCNCFWPVEIQEQSHYTLHYELARSAMIFKHP